MSEFLSRAPHHPRLLVGVAALLPYAALLKGLTGGLVQWPKLGLEEYLNIFPTRRLGVYSG